MIIYIHKNIIIIECASEKFENKQKTQIGICGGGRGEREREKEKRKSYNCLRDIFQSRLHFKEIEKSRAGEKRESKHVKFLKVA